MKKLFLLILIILTLSAVNSSAALAYDENLPRVVDNGNYFTDEQEAALERKAKSIIEKYKFDIVLVTENSVSDLMTYADNFYDKNGYGYGKDNSGLLFITANNHSNSWISTCGSGISVFTDYGISKIGEEIKPLRSADTEYEAYTKLLDLCDEFLYEADSRMPYDTDNKYNKSNASDILKTIGISLIIGFGLSFVISFIIMQSTKAPIKPSNASPYIKGNHINLTNSQDIFLFRTQTRVRRETQSQGGGSQTHSSPGGRRHGGGGF